jgi:heme exporter protein B
MALLRRDLTLSYRRRAEVLQPWIFLLVVVSLFPLGLGPSPQMLTSVAPGVIWIAALLATVLSLDTLFRPDFEDGSLECWFQGNRPP